MVNFCLVIIFFELLKIEELGLVKISIKIIIKIGFQKVSNMVKQIIVYVIKFGDMRLIFVNYIVEE